MKLRKLFLFAAFGLLFFSSCSDDDDATTPLNAGVDITMRNTLQDPGEAEATYASLFGQSDEAYDEFAVLSNTVEEFPTALAQTGTPVGDISGLYEIDLTETSISFTVLPELSDPFWGGFAEIFGVTPAGKTDRYYLTFSSAHDITSSSTNATGVNLRIDSETVIVVEVGEGFDVQPGVSFTIDLD